MEKTHFENTFPLLQSPFSMWKLRTKQASNEGLLLPRVTRSEVCLSSNINLELAAGSDLTYSPLLLI